MKLKLFNYVAHKGNRRIKKMLIKMQKKTLNGPQTTFGKNRSYPPPQIFNRVYLLCLFTCNLHLTMSSGVTKR